MKSKRLLIIYQSNGESDYRAFLESHLEYCPLDKGEEKIKNLELDIVMLDCGFNTDTCVNLLKSIKLSNPDVPVIFVTDASSEELVSEGFKSGARDYFKKPVIHDELRKSIAAILTLRTESLEKRRSMLLFNNDNTFEKLLHSDHIPLNILRSILYEEEKLYRPLSLDEIAREACQSKFHFVRQFKKFIGISPMRFVIKLRIDRAKFLLRKRDLPISCVAMQSGFNEVSEFNKQFKKITGLVPSTFRKSIETQK